LKKIMILIIMSFICLGCKTPDNIQEGIWPNITKESKPWTYWWWMGSAVDKANLDYNLELLSEGGFGGVHIIPVYGVKGEEENFIPYLSPEWIEMLDHTIDKAGSLDLGVDMTIGTGWPFGGPQVLQGMAAERLHSFRYSVSGKEQVAIHLIDSIREFLNRKFPLDPHFKLITVQAFSKDGQRIDLMPFIQQGALLRWRPNGGEWTIIALISESPVKTVKRAAPGGEGNVLDPFSIDHLNDYLARFDQAFASYDGAMVRSFYHDSYEYYGAEWTDGFLHEFERRRKYDLKDHLLQFAGSDNSDTAKRIRADYRQTLAELHTEFIEQTTEWSNNKSALFRNQAHGSPTNLLDSYAAADIPEVEVFGAPDLDIPGLRREEGFIGEDLIDPVMLRFSSSAAHVVGRNLVASETCTWLSDHFRVSLSQVKPEVDLLFLNGINHIIYHGIAYSPKEAIWPGWQFYASTSFAPTNTIWRDINSLNAYVSRCQSVLQAGKPDNNILIYFPVWDIWHDDEQKPLALKVHNVEDWLLGTPFYRVARTLKSKGYAFDYISDRQIDHSDVTRGKWTTQGNHYEILVVPDCRFMPETTMQKLADLMTRGARIVFMEKIQKKVPGYGKLDERQQNMDSIIKTLTSGRRQNLHIETDLIQAVKTIGIQREKIADHQIDFIRRRIKDGRYYFIANQQSVPLHDWVELAFPAKSVLILDPLSGKAGSARIKPDDNSCSVYLDIEPGKSVILKALGHEVVTDPWIYLKPQPDVYFINGEWSIRFIQGGPSIPQPLKVRNLKSWTAFDKDTHWFSGTAEYKITFRRPDISSNYWILDLGTVRESARVFVNGDSVSTLWSIPYRVPLINGLKEGDNELVIQVTNLAANRIRYLDTRGVKWKKFYDINFVNIHYKPFDASTWEPVPSGLIGPVKLYPATVE